MLHEYSYEVRDEDGNVIETWFTVQDAHRRAVELFRESDYEIDYTVHEVAAPVEDFDPFYMVDRDEI